MSEATNIAVIAALAATLGAVAGAWVTREGQKESLKLEMIKYASKGNGADQILRNLVIWKKIGLFDVAAEPSEIAQIYCDCDGGVACAPTGLQQHPEACFAK